MSHSPFSDRTGDGDLVLGGSISSIAVCSLCYCTGNLAQYETEGGFLFVLYTLEGQSGRISANVVEVHTFFFTGLIVFRVVKKTEYEA